MSAIKPFTPIAAPADVLAIARENCAIRARAKGQHEVAAAYEDGTGCEGWAFRHEVAKIKAEVAARERMAPMGHVPV